MTNLSRSYLFKTKDPVIDILRTLIQIYASVNQIKVNKAIRQIAAATQYGKDGSVRPQTIHNWLYGATISPRFCCVAAVANATGQGITIGEHVVGRGVRARRRRPTAIAHLRLVKAA